MTSAGIDNLIALWQSRASDKNYSASYRDAVSDCLYELKTIYNENCQEDYLDILPPEELSSLIDSWEADSYLASMEAHEHEA